MTIWSIEPWGDSLSWLHLGPRCCPGVAHPETADPRLGGSHASRGNGSREVQGGAVYGYPPCCPPPRDGYPRAGPRLSGPSAHAGQALLRAVSPTRKAAAAGERRCLGQGVPLLRRWVTADQVLPKQAAAYRPAGAGSGWSTTT